mgnify:CR=1 FL=1
MDRRMMLMGAGALAVGGAGAGLWVMRGTGGGVDSLPTLPGAASAQSGGSVDRVRVPEMSLGNPDARVTVIEYSSFTCPHCANFHRNVLPDIKANYIDTGRIHWIYREVFFDRFGLWAAMLARCGDASRFFPMAELLYENQRDWASSNDPAAVVDNLMRLGRRTGLSNEQMDACLQDGEQAQAMVAAYQHFAQEHGINSTPSFVINGTRHSNMSYADFARILDAALAG